MTPLTLLDEVVRELEQDSNLPRIKKLLIFVCKKTWESDSSKIDSFNLRDLLEELRNQNETLEKLHDTLNRRVNKINKKAEYLLVADTVISKVSQLYEQDDSRTRPLIMEESSDFLQMQAEGVEQPSVIKIKEKTEGKKVFPLNDVFDLRQKLMQGANPLRAKILIFSTLYHKFSFSDRDWSLLKKQDLDDLVRNLFHACNTLTELKANLYKTAKIVENPDKNLQAANAIIKILTPLYAALSNNSKTAILAEDTSDREPQTAISLPESKLNLEENSSDDDLSQISVLEREDFSQENNGRLEVAIAAPARHPESPESEEGSRKFSLAAVNISESIKQKREQEEKIKGLVSQNVSAVMSVMENTLSYLENDLESELKNENTEDYLSLKYQALGEFIKNVQETSGKFLDILSRLEEAERQRLSQ